MPPTGSTGPTGRALLAATLLPLMLYCQTLQAQAIYRTTDAEGNVVFTDTPPAGSGNTERVEIREPNTTPAPPPRPESAVAETEPAAAVNYRVEVVAPANETTIPMGPGNFGVQARVSPRLDSGMALQLYLGAERRGKPQQEASWQLTNVFRGAHDLSVAVLAADGKEVSRSAPVRVYVLRPSVNFRNRAN